MSLQKGEKIMMRTIHQMQVRDQRGFTLVELLIVVAIIAILAAIAIPQFAKYRARGHAATLNSDAKNAYTACAALFAGDPSVTECDCTAAQANGYTVSTGVTCSGGPLTPAGDGTLTFTHSAETVTPASITGNGELTPSKPL